MASVIKGSDDAHQKQALLSSSSPLLLLVPLLVSPSASLFFSVQLFGSSCFTLLFFQPSLSSFMSPSCLLPSFPAAFPLLLPVKTSAMFDRRPSSPHVLSPLFLSFFREIKMSGGFRRGLWFLAPKPRSAPRDLRAAERFLVSVRFFTCGGGSPGSRPRRFPAAVASLSICYRRHVNALDDVD